MQCCFDHAGIRCPIMLSDSEPPVGGRRLMVKGLRVEVLGGGGVGGKGGGGGGGRSQQQCWQIGNMHRSAPLLQRASQDVPHLPL